MTVSCCSIVFIAVATEWTDGTRECIQLLKHKDAVIQQLVRPPIAISEVMTVFIL